MKHTQAHNLAGPRREGPVISGMTLIEVIIAMGILLIFLAAIVPAMYRAQYSNMQSAYINASNSIVNALTPQFVAQRGPAFTRFADRTSGATFNGPTCDVHQGGPVPGNSAINLGDLSALDVFSQVTDSDAKGFNDPKLYNVTVRDYTQSFGGPLGERQMYEFSVFYPNPTNPNGISSCYSLTVASNTLFRAAP